MNYTTTLRDSFDDFEEKGRLRSRSKSYKTEVGRKRTRSIKLTLNDGASEEAEFTPSLKNGADNLVQRYPNDLEPSFAEELVHFCEYFKGNNLPRKEDALDDSDEAVSVELQMYRFLAKREIHEVFPNVEIALRIYLTLMVSNKEN
ncbi:Hypothetical predicted protein, partial [Paramuricea clavata]